jgi:hypothetical protein
VLVCQILQLVTNGLHDRLENSSHNNNVFFDSYAGLPCREVKGHAKSVGYEPGMKIPEDKFLNTWNAVLIMGDWWPVQCNWGARYSMLSVEQPIDLPCFMSGFKYSVSGGLLFAFPRAMQHEVNEAKLFKNAT